MKATVIAVFAAFLAVAAAEDTLPEEIFGKCPLFDGPSPAYLMDANHRNVYYECNNGKPVRMTCPKGLVFDPYENVCNYPRDDVEHFGMVGQCPCISVRPYPRKYLRDGANVAAYYLCYRKYSAVHYKCLEGTYFDMHTMRCKSFPYE